MSHDVISWTPQDEREPFRGAITEKPDGSGWRHEFELPALDSPGLPIELLSLSLLVLNKADDEERGTLALRGFIDYFRDNERSLYRALDRHPQTLAVLLGLVQRWAEHSGVDPKASS